jgi:uncharacterized protein (TIGR02246 family)
MRKTYGLLIVLLFVSLGFPRTTAGQAGEQGDLKSRLDDAVSRAMSAGQIPSLTMTLVSGDAVIWRGAWGMSNLRAPTPARPDTVYLIGSIFKTMQAVALLQLVEKGKLELDDPVSSYLDELEIRGEDPRNPVTFRHLLTHSSGIPGQAEQGAFPDAIGVDEETMRIIPHWDRPFQAYPIWGYALPPPIKEYLRKGLQVTRPPLERIEYSPMAFTLVAYIIEKLSGTPFMQYMRENIFVPVGMTSTAFIPTADMDERFAIPYAFDEERGTHVPLSRVRVAIWATGQVYGTSGDLAKWLIANLNGGSYGAGRIVNPEALSKAHQIQFDSDDTTTGWGLGWRVTEREGETYISHSGSLPGETAFVLASVTRKVGVAIVSNGNRAHRHLEPLAYEALNHVLSAGEEEEEVKQFVQRFAETWTNARNPEDIAAFYSVDATHVNPQGKWTRTRADLVPYFAPLVAGRSANFSAAFEIEDVEIVEPGYALVDGVITIQGMPGPDGKEIPHLEERYSFVMKKSEGEWFIHASRVMFPSEPRQ